MSAVRTLAVSVVVGLSAYLVPKYAWPILLEKARDRVTHTAEPVPGPVPQAVAAPEEAWTGVLLTPTVELTARLDAKVAKVNVRVGDVVRPGDILAEIDTTVQKHELAAAEASFRASRAETWQASVSLAQARDRQARRRAVVNYGGSQLPIVSGEELADAKFESAAASTRVSAASATAQERQAHLAQLRALLDEAKVRAPFAGAVATRYVEPGSHVHPGAPLLRIVGRGNLRTRFAVPEADGVRVSVGARVVLEWDDRRAQAVVDRVAPEVESSSGTIFVEATVEADDTTAQSVLTGRVVAVRPVAPGS